MTYRSKTDIIAVILKTASINGGAVKSKIMYEGFLAWAQVQEYLSLLLKNDLIKYQERGRTFIITEKGIRFLNIHNDLNKLMTAKQIENNKTAQTSSAQTAPPTMNTRQISTKYDYSITFRSAAAYYNMNCEEAAISIHNNDGVN